MKISEKQLRSIVRESVYRILNEVEGWELEPNDIQLVNSEDDGSHLFHIRLWWGSGYQTDNYQAYGFSEENALCNVIVWIEHNCPQLLEHSDSDAEAFKQELMQDKGIDEYEVDGDPEFGETFMYMDATMEGANQPHYIYSQNLGIQKVR